MNAGTPPGNDDAERVSRCDSERSEMPLIPTAVWIGSYLTALALQKYDLPHPLKVALVLLPLLPFIYFVRRFIVHLRSLDELHRRVHFEALAFAFPVAILLLMTLGLLEHVDALSPKHWTYGQVWFYLPLFYFVGLAVAWRRYR
ncbi:MAG: hypothetical protein ACJ8M1_13140 [Chthoniobacterales bacterium]